MTNRSAAGELNHRPLAPLPPQHNHYMAAATSYSTASLKGCCCCLFLLLIFLTLLSIAVTLVIILAVRPRKPEFDLQRVGVEYLLVAPEQGVDAGQTAAAYLSLNITLLFTAANPNKVGIKYEAADLYVLYHGVPLGIAAVPGFEQPAHSTRLVDSRVSVSRFNVLQADALELVRDATVNDRVELRITGDVGAKIRVLGFTSPRVQVSVDCVIVISPRKQSLTYKQCGVDGLNV
ncbi:NDR1/HIN1-like protein 13 [Phalaenopsis equestris]|uniref:NDR1/HIN1-like protein 13 n=1 Tax=Phalaenopsis equestris TaxID=78828 RepID=UPI0009E34BF9|nr:NDR1/HIN1-like protein 13 [Phalaenopsis equestris]